MGLLEGEEFKKDLGGYGQASVDVTPNLDVVVKVELKANMVDELEKLAIKTHGTLDDKAVAALKWARELLKVAG